jgi:hypothetical protein
VYRVKQSDPKQRQWFILDHALALPEYLVEFDYIQSQKSLTENKRLADSPVVNQEVNEMIAAIPKSLILLPPILADKMDGSQVHLTA